MNIGKNNKIDTKLKIFLFLFLIISILTIYSASMYLSPTLGKLYFKQLFWYIVGIFFILIINHIKMGEIKKYTPYIYITNVSFLICLLFFAREINGSKSWFIIPGMGSLQPSEFMKISLILMNGYIISNFYKKKKSLTVKKEFQLILSLIVTLIVPSILTFLQPDTGAVIIYAFITFIMLYVSEIRKSWFVALFLSAAVIISMFFYIYFFNQQLFIDIFGSGFFYRIDRLLNWQNGSGMQLNNSLIAISSGGILGHGFNKTPLYFPEAGTDFIFTVFVSNFGLIGLFLLITIIVVFDIYILKISKSTKILYNKLIVVGTCAMLLYQQIQNMAMTVGLLPITGITLPFISYGGSSLLSYLILIGVLSNIINENKKAIR